MRFTLYQFENAGSCNGPSVSQKDLFRCCGVVPCRCYLRLTCLEVDWSRVNFGRGVDDGVDPVPVSQCMEGKWCIEREVYFSVQAVIHSFHHVKLQIKDVTYDEMSTTFPDGERSQTLRCALRLLSFDQFCS